MIQQATREHSRVYPRVGGGNTAIGALIYLHHGLSPRGRGKLPPLPPPPSGKGSIPAWAGETLSSLLCANFQEVYPRVGGGNVLMSRSATSGAGLSPRGRGKLPPVDDAAIQIGSIPAWAGETLLFGSKNAICSVYPRVGGGNPRSVHYAGGGVGLSPRGRGKQHTRLAHRIRAGSIPAWAGETDVALVPPRPGSVYPRVGGGNIFTSRRNASVGGLSPRGRGKHGRKRQSVPYERSIPAWAGETDQFRRQHTHRRVYPRVGGGNIVARWRTRYAIGLSPRGRGKR